MAERIIGLDGDLLNLRYCYPCLENKVHAGMVSEENAAKLTAMVLGQMTIDRTLVQLCFPVACYKLFDFASRRNLAPWTLDTVRDFWRHHHDGKGDCAVQTAIVQQIQEKAVLVACEKKIIAVFNQYRLGIWVNAKVFLHQRSIIEIE